VMETDAGDVVPETPWKATTSKSLYLDLKEHPAKHHQVCYATERHAPPYGSVPKRSAENGFNDTAVSTTKPASDL